MRQRGDVLFQTLLDHMLNVGELTAAQLEMLRNRSINKVHTFGNDYTLITATHRDYAPFNRKKIQEFFEIFLELRTIKSVRSQRTFAVEF